MLKSCRYCGNIHPSGYICRGKPHRFKATSEQDKFRSTALWQSKREQIKHRDHYLCRACLAGLEGTAQRYNYAMPEVHHIVPIAEDYDLRLEDDNLITLCPHHHYMADAGRISLGVLRELIPKDEV